MGIGTYSARSDVTCEMLIGIGVLRWATGLYLAFMIRTTCDSRLWDLGAREDTRSSCFCMVEVNLVIRSGSTDLSDAFCILVYTRARCACM